MSEYNIGKKLKELRKSKKLTLQDVANETGFSAALISQVENENISPPIATLSRIAKFYDVKMGHFFSDGEEECRFEIIRANERKMVPRVISQDGTSHSYFYESLSRNKKNKRMDPFFLTLNDIAANTGTYSHDGEEFLFVMKGSAELILEEQRIILYEGDAAYFDSTLKHRLLSTGNGEVKVMAVVMR